MSNSPKVQAALDEVFKELKALSKEEFKTMMEEQEKAMIESIVTDTPNLGFTLWYGKNPEEAMAYKDKILKENKK